MRRKDTFIFSFTGSIILLNNFIFLVDSKERVIFNFSESKNDIEIFERGDEFKQKLKNEIIVRKFWSCNEFLALLQYHKFKPRELNLNRRNKNCKEAKMNEKRYERIEYGDVGEAYKEESWAAMKRYGLKLPFYRLHLPYPSYLAFIILFFFISDLCCFLVFLLFIFFLV